MLRMLEGATALELIGDAGDPHRVVADLDFDPGLPGSALKHAVSIRLPHALRRAGGGPVVRNNAPSYLKQSRWQSLPVMIRSG